MGLTQLNFAGLNKVEVAIARIKEFANEPYYFADSFGKDSCVVKHLLDMSHVNYEAHHHNTNIEPPELIYFGRYTHPLTIIDNPSESFWRLFPKNGFPTRKVRWCCRLLKETNGRGRFIVQGVRWQESAQRKSRRMFEICNKDKFTKFLNPIIDWTETEIWEFIHSEHIPYCSLYDEVGNDGKRLFKRLGCVLCPMHTAKQTQLELQRFPKIADSWYRAFEKFYLLGWDSAKRWDNVDKMWDYWLSRKGEPKVNDAQCIMFDKG